MVAGRGQHALDLVVFALLEHDFKLVLAAASATRGQPRCPHYRRTLLGGTSPMSMSAYTKRTCLEGTGPLWDIVSLHSGQSGGDTGIIASSHPRQGSAMKSWRLDDVLAENHGRPRAFQPPPGIIVDKIYLGSKGAKLSSDRGFNVVG